MKRCYLLLVLIILITQAAFSQLTLTSSSNTTELVNRFLSEGITLVGSPSKFCNSNGTGYFYNGHTTSSPLDSGIILSTGYASFLNRDYSFTASAGLNFGSGDAQLMTLTPYSITDICYIQFSFQPQYDSLVFEYVFGSEEYLEWVNSVFNDVFGFFLTGPDPNGGNYSNKNLALVPGTGDVVSINSINPTINASSFLNNFEGNWDGTFYPGFKDPGFTLDGFTTKLPIGISVVPNATYTIKMAIGDVSDPLWDSYVLLANKSFQSISTTLPIKLLEFNAEELSEEAVKLHWTTEIEEQNLGFSIQRSIDGIEWELIGFIDAVGNSSEVRDYQFIDNAPLKGYNYYRLEQEDLDGTLSYSEIRSVFMSNSSNFVQVGPNPVKNELFVKGEGIKGITLYNLLGQEVYGQTFQETSSVNIDVSELKRANYFLRILFEDGSMKTESILLH